MVRALRRRRRACSNITMDTTDTITREAAERVAYTATGRRHRRRRQAAAISTVTTATTTVVVPPVAQHVRHLWQEEQGEEEE